MKKSFIISSLTALAALCLCVNAQAQGPVVVSDKDDYSPGEIALFSAAGFQPGELLDFSVAISDENGEWLPDIAWADVPADASGGAEVDYVVPETWANKTLQLTVTGVSSGLMAQTTFTDSVSNVNFATSGLPVGTMVSVNYSDINNGGNPINGPVVVTSPGPTANIGVQAGSAFNFSFPASITVGMVQYDLVGTSEASPFHPPAGSPTPTTTITGTYALHVVTPTNNPPDINCTGNDAELGQVVGCLGTGTGFGQTFDVNWDVVDVPMSNAKIVQATFKLGTTTLAVVNVANVTDLDAGDMLSVTLSNETPSVTISGPGAGSASFSVDIHVDDNSGAMNATADATCDDGQANAQIVYNFGGFLPPLNGQINTKVKRGSGVPVKFQLLDCDGVTPITTGNHIISVAHLIPMAPMGDPTVDDEGLSGDGGTNFRYDPTGMLWIFNLKTNSSYVVGDSYQITATLDDGTDHNVVISIK